MKLQPSEALEWMQEIFIHENKEEGLRSCIDILNKTVSETDEKLSFSPVYNCSLKNFIGIAGYEVACDLFIKKIFCNLKDFHENDYETVMPQILFNFMPSNYVFDKAEIYSNVVEEKEVSQDKKTEIFEKLSKDLINNLLMIENDVENFNFFINSMKSMSVIMTQYAPKYTKLLKSVSDTQEDDLVYTMAKMIKEGGPLYVQSIFSDNIPLSVEGRKNIDLLVQYAQKIELNNSLNKNLDDQGDEIKSSKRVKI